MKKRKSNIETGRPLIRKILLTGISGLALVSVKAQVIDVSMQSQDRARRDTTLVSLVHDCDDIELTERDLIQETYQIPAYSLYDKYWDTENICSRHLSIPFEGSPLRIILVQSNNNPFFFPCIGATAVNNVYGEYKNEFHPGVDIVVKSGSPVKCCFDGVVRMAKLYGDYGRVVVVRHYNGLETVYAQLGKIMVKPGQFLQAGDIVGASGKDLKNGVEQLHFETRFMNECFNPSLFIDFDFMELKDNTLVLNESDMALGNEAEEKAEIKTDKQGNGNQEANQRQQQTDGQAEYHIVKAGDTMYRISIQHHVPLAKLLQMNNMKEADVIDIGQKIRVK